MFTDVTTLFCNIDDFCQKNSSQLNQDSIQNGIKKRIRQGFLTMSEIMTILVLFHSSNYRDFKHFYMFLLTYNRKLFPSLVSYHRFVELTPSALLFLCAYLNSIKGKCTGIQFIDSTALKVCKNKRIFNHKVFDGIAQRGKNTMGFFFGFKLHIIVNDIGELLAFKLTPGNTDDREPLMELSKELWGLLFGDKGYLSADKFEKLYKERLKLITPIKANMKNKLMIYFEKIMLRKRSIVETINDQLKNISQIEHTRHRSVWNFMVNVVSGLIAYSNQVKKPSIRDFESEFCGVNLLA